MVPRMNQERLLRQDSCLITLFFKGILLLLRIFLEPGILDDEIWLRKPDFWEKREDNLTSLSKLSH